MDLQLRGKRAVVTGSSSGIGTAIAKSLAAEGALVLVHGRREPETRRVAAAIVAAGGRAVVALGDLATDAAADRVAQVANDAFGGVDILVNNAGAFPQKPWLETSAAEWTALYDQNVGSMVRLVTRLVPGMKERRRHGRYLQRCESGHDRDAGRRRVAQEYGVAIWTASRRPGCP